MGEAWHIRENARAFETHADRLLARIERLWARRLLAKAWREGDGPQKKPWPTNLCPGCRKPVAQGVFHGRVCEAEARRRTHVKRAA